MKYLISPLMWLMISGPLHAQSFAMPKYQLSISYFGEMLTHRGIRLGLTAPLSQKIKEKPDSKIVNKGWVVGGALTYYKHPRNHKAWMITGAIGRQRIGRNGLQTLINFEAGYMLSLLDGEAYKWDGSAIVSANKGSSHVVFGFNGGVGWNFDKVDGFPVSFMVLPHLYFQAPYNTLIVPRVALETRLSYTLKK